MRAALALFLALAATLPARAQEASDETRARALFAEGREALRDGRPDDARAALDRSMRLVPNAGTAFNLGVANLATDHPVEAHALFEQLLDGAHGPLEPRQAQQVETLDQRARDAIATLRVDVAGAAQAEVRVDERRSVVTTERPWNVSLDPGTHRVALIFEGEPRHERELTLAAGEQRVLTLRVPSAAPTAPAAQGEEPSEGESVAESPWLWVTLAVALLGAGVAIGVVLALDGTSEPLEDEVFGVSRALVRF